MSVRRLKTAVCIFMLSICMVFAFALRARAEDTWPYPSGTIEAEGAIVMDADTGTVLWGRNQHVSYCPASITKIMTALLVLENCGLDEEVTITADAVYNLESGATTASLSVGDVLSVEDLLYALLLRSANDAANALAIHVSGSITDFAKLMNQRAAELGCLNTDFRNPSGLTDPEHLTTAYDMALIMSACIKVPEFLEIESHDTYTLAATEKYPSGLRVTMGHKMLRSGTDYSDDRVIAGKTGFITASGNTLVTAARDDDSGRTVITCVLKDEMPKHYTDTQKLLEFGFGYFENVTVPDPVSTYGCVERLETDRIISGGGNHILAQGDAVMTLPLGGDASEASVKYDYNIPAGAPELACAVLKFYYESRQVGSLYLLNDRESELVFEDERTADEGGVYGEDDRAPFPAGPAAAAAAALVLAGLAAWRISAHRKEQKRLSRLRERRRSRLEDMGMTEEEFGKHMRDREEKRAGRGGGLPRGSR